MLVAWYGVPWRGMLLPGAAASRDERRLLQPPRRALHDGRCGHSSALATSGNDEMQEWFASSWGFAKQILPLLLVGVIVAGLLLGSTR